MIYLTGDTHGDFSRFKRGKMPHLKRGDTLIVCGDFGFIWDGSKKEQRLLKKLARKRYRILFVEGSHDNLGLLYAYDKVEFAGGQAHKIAHNIYHLMRGEVFRIEDRTLFAFGGGESDDRDWREEGKTWWEEELPTPEECARGKDNLALCENKVDYVITYEAPASVSGFIDMDANTVNILNTYFEQISKACTYKSWYFGCYHLDKVITPSQTACFRQVIALK